MGVVYDIYCDLIKAGVLKLGSADKLQGVREQSFGFFFLKRWHWRFFSWLDRKNTEIH